MDSTTGLAPKRRLAICDLPFEVRRLIYSHFCLHCHPPDIKEHKPSFDKQPNEHYDSLRALCLVSRAFRSEAQPILFHACISRRANPGPELRSRLTQLMQTLQRRPDLVHHVKMLDIDGFDKQCTCCYPYDEHATPEEEEVCMQAAGNAGLTLERDQLLREDFDETIIQIIITQLPALEDINICIHRDWRFRLLSSWKPPGVDMMTLSSVKRMQLDLDPRPDDICSEGHEDCNHASPVSPVEALLIHATPNIESLCCTAGGLDDLPVLQRLKSLQISGRGSWPGKLAKLMRRLPSLMRLSYTSGNEHFPSPRELEDALQGHKDQLEELSMTFEHHIMYRSDAFLSWTPPVDPPYRISSLSDFSRLKRLRIDSSMIWPVSEVSPESQQHVLDDETLVRILPESLEVVFVTNMLCAEVPIKVLAEAVVGGRFQNLQQVFWYREYEIICMNLEERKSPRWLEDGSWEKPVPSDVNLYLQQGQFHAFPDWNRLWRQGVAYHCVRKKKQDI